MYSRRACRVANISTRGINGAEIRTSNPCLQKGPFWIVVGVAFVAGERNHKHVRGVVCNQLVRAAGFQCAVSHKGKICLVQDKERMLLLHHPEVIFCKILLWHFHNLSRLLTETEKIQCINPGSALNTPNVALRLSRYVSCFDCFRLSVLPVINCEVGL